LEEGEWWNGRWIGRWCFVGGGICVVALRGRDVFFSVMLALRFGGFIGRVFDLAMVVEIDWRLSNILRIELA
jgi:hypothetical protein